MEKVTQHEPLSNRIGEDDGHRENRIRETPFDRASKGQRLQAPPMSCLKLTLCLAEYISPLEGPTTAGSASSPSSSLSSPSGRSWPRKNLTAASMMLCEGCMAALAAHLPHTCLRDLQRTMSTMYWLPDFLRIFNDISCICPEYLRLDSGT